MKSAAAVQVFRKLVQFSSVGFVVYAGLSMHWRNFKVAHNSSRITGLMAGDGWGFAYMVNDQMLTKVGDPLEVSDGMLGGPWAAHVAGFPIVDPYAVASVLAGGSLPPTAMLMGALMPVVLAVVLGKVFCSYLCPARLAFELGNAVRRSLIWLGVPLPEMQIPRLGLWVGAATVLFAAGAGPAIFHLVLPYLSISSAILGYTMAGAITTTAIWAVVLVAVDAFVAPGQICRSICPTGALLEQFGRASPLRIVRETAPCPPSCDVCQRACPYGLFPGKLEHRPACDTCGRCTVACPQKKLGFGARLPWAGLALFGLLGLLAAPGAEAHHNKGLPHYGYFDNYPQVPTEEFIDVVGRWEVGMVMFNFQGMDRKTSDTPDDIRIFAYVYDLEKDAGYKGPLTLSLATPEGEVINTFARLEPDQEGVYVVRQQMPGSGDFVMQFEFDLEGETHEVPLDFWLDLSVDRIDWWILGGAGTLLGGLFLFAALSRKDRAGRRAPAVN
jgi:ferredoxin-type protein NapH